jgi:hypothetical protein
MTAGPTYAEARQWIVWLKVVTVRELADVMAVDDLVAEIFIRAAEWHGIIRNGGVTPSGEQLFSYVPLPRGPREHVTLTPPEVITPGVYSEAPRRGFPIAGTSSQGTRRAVLRRRSTVGGGRRR